MTCSSDTSLLVLHAVRVLGFADTVAIAARYGTGIDTTTDLLRDAERCGWVEHFSFADLGGWSLTDAGQRENQRQLADERSSGDPEGRIVAVYRDFLPLNARLLRAVTDWQIAPTSSDPFAANDHRDTERDRRILDELADIGAALTLLIGRLTDVLTRFAGYAERFHVALGNAKGGEVAWVDRSDIDSCHRVWFQLHEDLIATLGIERGE